MLRAGIVGMGPRGRRWAQAMKTIEETTGRVKLVAVAEISEQRRERARDLLGCKAFKDHREMLDSGGLDMVCVATSCDAHKEPAVDALKAGIHVICEKPLADTLEDARYIAQEAKRSDPLFMVGFELRFTPAHNRARERFLSGELGRVCNFSYYKMKKLFHPSRNSVSSPFLEETVHAFDLIGWQLAPVESVLASVMERTIYGPETDVHPILDPGEHEDGPFWDASGRSYPDTCWAVLRLSNGAIGPVGQVVGLPYAGTAERYIVVTDKASVFIEYHRCRICWRRGWQSNPLANTVEETVWSPPPEGHQGATRVMLDHFIDCVEEGIPMQGATAEDGLTAIKVAIACEKAAKEKREIKLSEL